MANRKNVKNVKDEFCETDIYVIACNRDGRLRYLGYNDEGVFESFSLCPWMTTANLHEQLIFTNELQAIEFLEECREKVRKGEITISCIDKYEVLPLIVKTAYHTNLK